MCTRTLQIQLVQNENNKKCCICNSLFCRNRSKKWEKMRIQKIGIKSFRYIESKIGASSYLGCSII